jgi:hypothetical protein
MGYWWVLKSSSFVFPNECAFITPTRFRIRFEPARIQKIFYKQDSGFATWICSFVKKYLWQICSMDSKKSDLFLPFFNSVVLHVKCRSPSIFFFFFLHCIWFIYSRNIYSIRKDKIATYPLNWTITKEFQE